MSLTIRHDLWLAGPLLAICALGRLAADEPAKPAAVTGFKAGERMPFFVVDFCYGSHKGSGDCPGVMVSNAKAKGVIVLAHRAGDEVLVLANSLSSHTDGEKVIGHLVVLDAKGDALAAQCEKAGLKSFEVGIPRVSQREMLSRAGLTDKVAVAVLFTHGKDVQAAQLLAAGELTPEKAKELSAAADAFAKQPRSP